MLLTAGEPVVALHTPKSSSFNDPVDRCQLVRCAPWRIQLNPGSASPRRVFTSI
jgi:hypothetical protein